MAVLLRGLLPRWPAPTGAGALLRRFSAQGRLRRNEEIRGREVVFLDQKGVRQGVVAPAAILAQVDRRLYDLVEVNPGHSPPICRLVSRSEAFRRQQVSAEAAARERLRCREKEIRFGTSMAEHDYAIRLGRLREALERAFRVRVVVEPRGLLGRTAMAKERLWGRVFAELGRAYGKDLALLSAPQVEFRNLTATLALSSARPSGRGSREPAGQGQEA